MTTSPSRTFSMSTLSSKEIFEISQEISRKYSPLVSVKSFAFTKRITLTSKELLEISEDINRKYMPKLNSSRANLVVLPIDQTHLYVSWNPGKTEQNSTAKEAAKAFVLRVYPKPDENPSTATKTWFDVDLDQASTRQQVTVPNEYSAGSFTATIGIRDQDNHLTHLATSKTIHAPPPNMALYPTGDNQGLSAKISQTNPYKQDRLQNTSKSASGQGVK